MTIEEILQVENTNNRIQYLQSQRNTTDEKIEEAKKQLDPNQHAVTDPSKRKKREVTYVKEVNGEKETKTEPQDVNRIPFSYQRKIVDSRISFMLGNPVQVFSNSKDPNAGKILDAIIKVNEDVKIDSGNREIFRTMFSFYEVAELWATTESDEMDRYGFASDVKFRLQVFGPDKGDKLYPFFDEFGDMVAFSRAFSRDEIRERGKKTIQYFETWTKDSYTRLVKDGSDWVEDESDYAKKEDARVKMLGIIPIVYGYQKETEWNKVQKLCDRMDTLASNHADINDRHSSPILVAKNATVENKLYDFAQIKGENAALEYIERAGASTDAQQEHDRLLAAIHYLTSTPQFSFDAMKGMGNILSGEGLKTALMDAHLEVFNKMEQGDIYLTRRYNIIKRILGVMNNAWEKSMSAVKISVKVTPYMAGDDIAKINALVELYNAGMISLESACKMNPWFEDAIAEYNRIKADQAAKDSDPKGLDDAMNNDN